jgi:hypothetical protein
VCWVLFRIYFVGSTEKPRKSWNWIFITFMQFWKCFLIFYGVGWFSIIEGFSWKLTVFFSIVAQKVPPQQTFSNEFETIKTANTLEITEKNLNKDCFVILKKGSKKKCVENTSRFLSIIIMNLLSALFLTSFLLFYLLC